jgi:beta-lactamase class A
MNTIKSLPLIVMLLAVGFAGGWFSGISWFKADTASSRKSEVHLGQSDFGYHYINPLLACEDARESIEDTELRPFKNKVFDLIGEKKKKLQISAVSVYFREMNNGLVFMIGDKERFAPASLLKVPDMIAYYKWTENEPDILKRKIKFVNLPDLNFMQNFKPAQTLEYGREYTIEELIRRSIEYSDNNAEYLLQRNLSSQIRRRVYSDLGIPLPVVKDGELDITINEYAAFFRILFNASYLTRDLSEKALKTLSAPDFPVGISAGIPSDIEIAQKYGERIMGERQEIKQLHDCGIVYYPNHPYLLCIMTRGAEFDPLVETIRDISYLVYKEVNKQYSRPSN